MIRRAQQHPTATGTVHTNDHPHKNATSVTSSYSTVRVVPVHSVRCEYCNVPVRSVKDLRYVTTYIRTTVLVLTVEYDCAQPPPPKREADRRRQKMAAYPEYCLLCSYTIPVPTVPVHLPQKKVENENESELV